MVVVDGSDSCNPNFRAMRTMMYEVHVASTFLNDLTRSPDIETVSPRN